MGILERLLGLGSLECFDTPLVCQQLVLFISYGVISLISSKVITLATYLGGWALIALVIASKFLLDFRMFLLEAISASNLGPLLFQAHLAST